MSNKFGYKVQRLLQLFWIVLPYRLSHFFCICDLSLSLSLSLLRNILLFNPAFFYVHFIRSVSFVHGCLHFLHHTQNFIPLRKLFVVRYFCGFSFSTSRKFNISSNVAHIHRRQSLTSHYTAQTCFFDILLHDKTYLILNIRHYTWHMGRVNSIVWRIWPMLK